MSPYRPAGAETVPSGAPAVPSGRVLTAADTPHGTRYVVEMGAPGSGLRAVCYGLPAAGWWLVPRRALADLASSSAGGGLPSALGFVSRLLTEHARRRHWPARGVYIQVSAEGAGPVAALQVPPWGVPVGGPPDLYGRLWFLPAGRNLPDVSQVPPPDVASAARRSLCAARVELVLADRDAARRPAGSAGPRSGETGQAAGGAASGRLLRGPHWSEEYRCVARAPGTVGGTLTRQARMSSSLRRLAARSGYLLRNGEPVTSGDAVRAGDWIAVLVPSEPSGVEAEAGPLDVLYSDADLLVVSKPAGMLTHPARRQRRGTLANRAAGYLVAMGGPAAARPVGRLDRGVSGLVIFARTRYAHAALARDRGAGRLMREYLALAGPGRASDPGGGSDAPVVSPAFDSRRYPVPREAKTRWRVLARWPGGSLLLVRPETGRTHQIRQHLAAAGLALLGDTLYGGAGRGINRPALHAWRVRLRQPVDWHELEVRAPLPAGFRRLAARLARPVRRSTAGRFPSSGGPVGAAGPEVDCRAPSSGPDRGWTQ